MRAVFIRQSVHLGHWQLKSQTLPHMVFDCLVINDPHAPDSYVHESKADLILKVAKWNSMRLLSVETGQINPKLSQDIEKYLLHLMPVPVW